MPVMRRGTKPMWYDSPSTWTRTDLAFESIPGTGSAWIVHVVTPA
eukprot:CAMPEP_0182571378 /NCGR_PEP_ID=MMETSP1324-20130603/13317_1 /TAXON_ID=236786 /ORGANISM="Florenciella sp., Strain RCC1587" /LENGTH=44 /DNA_ID= /DNA_START= /DNA_END= /DNA_ORIENTATION=